MININPNRINIAGGTAGKTGERRRGQDTQGELVVPSRASVGTIPEPETLATLIRSAVSALRGGVFWDRGTILNLVV
ncbi:MAG: hypothetical protein EBR02_08030 [Alphaproteobacteria bacterium]|nr:hypothetical protein [Alphaproteobacteria bacterium]